MKIKTKYLIAFLSSTFLTLAVIVISWWGLAQLEATTDFLVDHNSLVLELASLYEKDLAVSRRAEKEFFIFPNNPTKQDEYVGSWQKSYATIHGHIAKLIALYEKVGDKEMVDKMKESDKLLTENETLWATSVAKFKEIKEYDPVNKAEYGEFKKKTHVIEANGKLASTKGLDAVVKGREDLAAKQKLIMKLLLGVGGFAILIGIVMPLVLATKMTNVILQLTQVSDAVSVGKLDQEINIERKDELGDLARAIKRMQKSFTIMMGRLSRA